jgi:hypothetical protein
MSSPSEIAGGVCILAVPREPRLDAEMSDCLVVGRLENRDEIALAENGVFSYHLASDLADIIGQRREPISMLSGEHERDGGLAGVSGLPRPDAPLDEFEQAEVRRTAPAKGTAHRCRLDRARA